RVRVAEEGGHRLAVVGMLAQAEERVFHGEERVFALLQEDRHHGGAVDLRLFVHLPACRTDPPCTAISSNNSLSAACRPDFCGKSRKTASTPTTSSRTRSGT